MHGPCYVLSRTYLIGPFANRLCNVYHIALLEGISTQHLGADLSCDNHHWGAIHHRIGYARNRVCGARTTRYQTNACLSAYASKPFSCMCSGLFVAHQYMVQLVAIVVECIVNGHDCTAWIAEERLHALVYQCTHQYLCASYVIIVRFVHRIVIMCKCLVNVQMLGECANVRMCKCANAW